MSKSTSILAILLMVVTLAPRAHAQSVASQALLDAAVQQHVATTEANRATVLRVLDHPDVTGPGRPSRRGSPHGS